MNCFGTTSHVGHPHAVVNTVLLPPTTEHKALSDKSIIPIQSDPALELMFERLTETRNQVFELERIARVQEQIQEQNNIRLAYLEGIIDSLQRTHKQFLDHQQTMHTFLLGASSPLPIETPSGGPAKEAVEPITVPVVSIGPLLKEPITVPSKVLKPALPIGPKNARPSVDRRPSAKNLKVQTNKSN